jgi:hypothetical protein
MTVPVARNTVDKLNKKSLVVMWLKNKIPNTTAPMHLPT